MRVNKIQTVDSQHLEVTVKNCSFAAKGPSVVKIASREAENE